MPPRGQHRVVQPWKKGTNRCQVCGYVDCRSKDSLLFATWECHNLHEEGILRKLVVASEGLDTRQLHWYILKIQVVGFWPEQALSLVSKHNCLFYIPILCPLHWYILLMLWCTWWS